MKRGFFDALFQLFVYLGATGGMWFLAIIQESIYIGFFYLTISFYIMAYGIYKIFRRPADD